MSTRERSNSCGHRRASRSGSPAARYNYKVSLSPMVPIRMPPAVAAAVAKIKTSEESDIMKAITECLEIFSYSSEGPKFNIDKDRKVSDLLITAEAVLLTAKSIQCIEATLLAIKLTHKIDAMIRFPISFQSRCLKKQKTHKHLVLGTFYKNNYGALGKSRSIHLESKQPGFSTLMELIQSYIQGYKKEGQTVITVTVGSQILPNEDSEVVQWDAFHSEVPLSEEFVRELEESLKEKPRPRYATPIRTSCPSPSIIRQRIPSPRRGSVVREGGYTTPLRVSCPSPFATRQSIPSVLYGGKESSTPLRTTCPSPSIVRQMITSPRQNTTPLRTTCSSPSVASRNLVCESSTPLRNSCPSPSPSIIKQRIPSPRRVPTPSRMRCVSPSSRRRIPSVRVGDGEYSSRTSPSPSLIRSVCVPPQLCSPSGEANLMFSKTPKAVNNENEHFIPIRSPSPIRTPSPIRDDILLPASFSSSVVFENDAQKSKPECEAAVEVPSSGIGTDLADYQKAADQLSLNKSENETPEVVVIDNQLETPVSDSNKWASRRVHKEEVIQNITTLKEDGTKSIKTIGQKTFERITSLEKDHPTGIRYPSPLIRKRNSKESPRVTRRRDTSTGGCIDERIKKLLSPSLIPKYNSNPPPPTVSSSVQQVSTRFVNRERDLSARHTLDENFVNKITDGVNEEIVIRTHVKNRLRKDSGCPTTPTARSVKSFSASLPIRKPVCSSSLSNNRLNCRSTLDSTPRVLINKTLPPSVSRSARKRYLMQYAHLG